MVFGHVESSMYNLDVCQKRNKQNVAGRKAVWSGSCSLLKLRQDPSGSVLSELRFPLGEAAFRKMCECHDQVMWLPPQPLQQQQQQQQVFIMHLLHG